MTLHLLKLHLQTFLSIAITQKCQILSCEALVANERYAGENARQEDELVSSMRPRPRLLSPKEATFCILVVYLMAIY
jgi:hypothetical protein